MPPKTRAWYPWPASLAIERVVYSRLGNVLKLCYLFKKGRGFSKVLRFNHRGTRMGCLWYVLYRWSPMRESEKN